MSVKLRLSVAAAIVFVVMLFLLPTVFHKARLRVLAWIVQHEITKKERIVLASDVNSIASEVRAFAGSRRWSLTKGDPSPDRFSSRTTQMPKSLSRLEPLTMWIFDDRVEIDCGGPLASFGLVIFREGVEGNGTEKLADGVWYFSDNGQLPSP